MEYNKRNGEFIALSTSIKVKEMSQRFNDDLQKQECTKPQIGRRQGIIRIRAEINEIKRNTR